jgi:hypothetical protein
MGRLIAERAARPAAPTPAGDRRGGRPRPPGRLKTKTAVAYSQALAALDGGDRLGAAAKLKDVLAQQPDFQLARLDLEKLAQ